MIRPSFDLIAVQETLNALEGLADERGKKWKRQAFMEAGKEAFKPIVATSKTLAPHKSGLTQSGITATKAVYNADVAKALTKTGRVKRRAKSEFHIATTLSNSASQMMPLNSKGRRVRYPFMLEVGVAQGTYRRGNYFRDGKRIAEHNYKRTAPRKPLLFMHKSLHGNANSSVNIWAGIVNKYINAYQETTYKSAKTAIKAVERRAATGKFTPSKWR